MLKIGCFNIENLDDKEDARNPGLNIRAPVLRRCLERMDADIVCLQEVHGQELPDHTSSSPSRDLLALKNVVAGTRFEHFHVATTRTADGKGTPYNQRNLVLMCDPSIAIEAVQQHRNEILPAPQYRKVMANPAETTARDIGWERPILEVQLTHPRLGTLHVLNLHLKSRLASNIPGQRDGFSWRSAGGWAEGYFLSSVRRVGQALETRMRVDQILDADPATKVVVCGDFNAEPGEVPVEAICGRVENTDNPALRGHVLVPCSRSIPESTRFSHLHHGRGNLLDHMLISQSLLAHFRGAEIHNENLHDESLPFAFDVKYPESDHAPFVSVFDDH